jgi:hypothetical protein
MLLKDYESKYSVEKKLLVVSLKGLVAKTNWLAVNRSREVTLALAKNRQLEGTGH